MADAVRVELTVAGHSVTVEAAESLSEVAVTALALFRATAEDARRSPVGFAPGGGQFELGPRGDE